MMFTCELFHSKTWVTGCFKDMTDAESLRDNTRLSITTHLRVNFHCQQYCKPQPQQKEHMKSKQSKIICTLIRHSKKLTMKLRKKKCSSNIIFNKDDIFTIHYLVEDNILNSCRRSHFLYTLYNQHFYKHNSVCAITIIYLRYEHILHISASQPFATCVPPPVTMAKRRDPTIVNPKLPFP